MSAILFDLPSPTALDTRPPEVREWETCHEYYEGPIDFNLERNPPMSVVLEDERVGQLLAEDYEEPEPLMGSLQSDLRKGNRKLATHLLTVIRNDSLEPSVRSLALETLAGARVRSLDNEVRDVIRETLTSKDSELQFTAVAAASDLSRQSQVLLAGLIRALATASNDYYVKRAATAFLSRL